MPHVSSGGGNGRSASPFGSAGGANGAGGGGGNEDFFARMGEANAQRKEGLPPSQGESPALVSLPAAGPNHRIHRRQIHRFWLHARPACIIPIIVTSIVRPLIPCRAITFRIPDCAVVSLDEIMGTIFLRRLFRRKRNSQQRDSTGCCSCWTDTCRRRRRRLRGAGTRSEGCGAGESDYRVVEQYGGGRMDESQPTR